MAGEEFFLACNADNLTDFDLRDLIDEHRAWGAVATLTAFHSENPSAGGVLELDERRLGRPASPKSPLTRCPIW